MRGNGNCVAALYFMKKKKLRLKPLLNSLLIVQYYM